MPNPFQAALDTLRSENVVDFLHIYTEAANNPAIKSTDDILALLSDGFTTTDINFQDIHTLQQYTYLFDYLSRGTFLRRDENNDNVLTQANCALTNILVASQDAYTTKIMNLACIPPFELNTLPKTPEEDNNYSSHELFTLLLMVHNAHFNDNNLNPASMLRFGIDMLAIEPEEERYKVIGKKVDEFLQDISPNEIISEFIETHKLKVCAKLFKLTNESFFHCFNWENLSDKDIKSTYQLAKSLMTPSEFTIFNYHFCELMIAKYQQILNRQFKIHKCVTKLDKQITKDNLAEILIPSLEQYIVELTVYWRQSFLGRFNSMPLHTRRGVHNVSAEVAEMYLRISPTNIDLPRKKIKQAFAFGERGYSQLTLFSINPKPEKEFYKLFEENRLSR